MRPATLAVVAVLAAAGGPAVAEVIEMPQGGASAQSGAVYQMPARGMSMARVAERFGAPADKLPAVGRPPITRWVYPGYTVYFERNLVIHSVINKGPRATPAVESPGEPARLTDMP